MNLKQKHKENIHRLLMNEPHKNTVEAWHINYGPEMGIVALCGLVEGCKLSLQVSGGFQTHLSWIIPNWGPPWECIKWVWPENIPKEIQA